MSLSKITTKLIGIALLALLLPSLGSAQQAIQTVKLRLRSSGASENLTPFRAQELELSPQRPPTVRKTPSNLKAPLYGVIRLGIKDKPTTFTVLMDAEENKPSHIWIDSNTDGDLTNDATVKWESKRYAGRERDDLVLSVGSITLPVRYGKEILPLTLKLSRYDVTEPPKTPPFLPLYYSADYTREGEMTFHGKKYNAMLAELLTTGDWRGSGIPKNSGVFLLIDLNGNGKIDRRGEVFDAYSPFNIGGVTYELQGVEASGHTVSIVRSKKTVAEIPPPPDLRVGKKIPAFEAVTMTGEKVKFPQDYKGKFVLLYFWASWCGDCVREIPYITQTYDTHQAKGFDILGVSLDHPNVTSELTAFLKQHKMGWSQIYEGKHWETTLAKQFFVTHTPSPFLVNGDTGEILATELALLGEQLTSTVANALAKKK